MVLLAVVLPAHGQDAGRAGAPTAKVVIRGAGATFPAPLYEKWIATFRTQNPDLTITYDVVGSGEGQKRFLANAVDFGASDAALNDEQLARVKPGAQLVPVTAGMVVLAYNLPGLGGDLRLSRAVCADIFGGTIKTWDDPRIRADNPGLALPHRSIVMIVRQDGSGTTYAFSAHLSAVSAAWRDQGPGVGTLLSWPGNTMRARGNEGVAGRIKVSEGSIGYVEYHFAKRLGLPVAQLQNRAGRFIAPSESERADGPRPQRQADAAQPAPVPARPRGRGRLPDRVVQLAAPLRSLSGPREGHGPEEVRGVGAHRGPEHEPRARLHPVARRGRRPFSRRPGADQLIRRPRGDAPPRRVDLAAVEASLRQVQREFEAINARLSSRREPMSDRVVENMLTGYAFVDALLAAGIDVFAMGNLKNLLELNTIVLCGTDPARRDQYARHIEATERRFYEERDGGIQDVVEWYARHRSESAWHRAAGAYVRVLSKPQLFVEGNHRTGALLMSYILMGDGHPPFVLSPANAAAYFDPSTVIKHTAKKSAAMLFRAPGLKRRLARLLLDHADRRYLLT